MASDEDVKQIDDVLNAFAQQIVEGMVPVCKLYASIPNRGLRQQLAQALALLLRSNDVLQPGFGASDDDREQLAKEIRTFLEQKESSDGG